MIRKIESENWDTTIIRRNQVLLVLFLAMPFSTLTGWNADRKRAG